MANWADTKRIIHFRNNPTKTKFPTTSFQNIKKDRKTKTYTWDSPCQTLPSDVTGITHTQTDNMQPVLPIYFTFLTHKIRKRSNWRFKAKHLLLSPATLHKLGYLTCVNRSQTGYMVTINALSLSLFVMLIFIYICDPFVVYLCLKRFRPEG